VHFLLSQEGLPGLAILPLARDRNRRKITVKVVFACALPTWLLPVRGGGAGRSGPSIAQGQAAMASAWAGLVNILEPEPQRLAVGGRRQ
jgi:hypothetical protein